MSHRSSNENVPDRPRLRLTLIVATAENGVIGHDGDLPWRLPADLARFKRLTMGHAMIMGRKTYESIGRPLPGRVSIVLTRDQDWQPEHDAVRVANSFAEAEEFVREAEGVADDEAFVIGGGEIYRLALPYANGVQLTRVQAVIEGDAFFPPLPSDDWTLISSEEHAADERNEHGYAFEVWNRIDC